MVMEVDYIALQNACVLLFNGPAGQAILSIQCVGEEITLCEGYTKICCKSNNPAEN